MTIERAAEIYVNIVDPALRIGLFVVIAVFLLYFLNLLRDGSKKTDMVNGLFNLIIKTITKTVTLTGKVLLFILSTLRKTITVIFASLRDFFISEI